ncbi:MAG TPA: adenylate/guanylate cyclase domain-containing protein [Reyranella sp.]|nr:adenylate/guanylate cyclase domain-containing protein [Reyranella sp.]
MASKRLDRRLSAVLAADVAGYGRLVSIDEEGTIGQLKAHRALLFDPKLAEHNGRLVKTTGDGLLAEFASVVDAVRCAVDVQRGMAARNAEVIEDKRIEFRIGVHVGDIIIEDDDIFGDGVNVAARLEGLAEPGGICVSARVQEDAEGRLDVGFIDDGEQQLKNIARPVRVYRVALDGAQAPSGARAVAPTPGTGAAPDMPSIAVLPFQNMSADPDQDYFADGMVEDIITGLSRYRNIFVIARNSTFTYKGRAVDVKQVGRELGVRYVLEGSVRRAGSRVRITGQLIDAATAVHIWAERFEGEIEDIFDLQDRVAASVVGAIVPQLRQAEVDRAKRKPTESLDAHISYMRGIASFQRWGREAIDEALRLAHRAIELDPNYSTPYGLAVSCYVVRKANGWMADREQEIAETARLTARAAEVGRDDAFALSSSGFAIANILGDLDAGAALIDRALALTPNYSLALVQSGYVRVWLGEPDLAIEQLQQAMRLSPVDSLMFMMQTAMAFAHFIAGRYDEAYAWAEKALQRNPFVSPATRIAAASAALLGRSGEAAKYLALLRQLDPGLVVSNLKERVNLRRPDDLSRLAEGLRKAGLPE